MIVQGEDHLDLLGTRANILVDVGGVLADMGQKSLLLVEHS